VFALKQALALFDFYGQQVADCDELMEQQMVLLHRERLAIPSCVRRMTV